VVALVVELLILPSGAVPAGCAQPVSIAVNSSTEKADALREMAGRYNASGRTFGGRCASVQVTKTTSGTAMNQLAAGWSTNPANGPEPQVWTPTSSLWLGLLRNQGKGGLLRDAEPPSITRSVLAVAMPQVMADVLRRKTKDAGLGWSDILQLVPGRGGWSSVDGARPEWGQFQLGRDNPHISTSGLAATIAIYHAATRAATGRTGVTAADVDDARVVSFVHDVESSVAHYGDDATVFMETLYNEDRKRPQVPYISAVVVQEQLAFLYNRGAPSGDPGQLGGAKPNDPLVALHPDDGTFMLDHPYVVLASATPGQRAAADDFRAFLLEPDQQKRFAQFGFRGLDGRPGAELAQTLGFDAGEKLVVVEPPAPALLDKMVKAWDAVRRKARVLLVLDVSGSMNDLADPGAVPGSELGGKSRLDLVKPAALRGIDLLGDEDEVGLWTFSSEAAPGQPPYTEHVPISRLGGARQRLTDAITGLRAHDNTALYRTTKAAHKMMADRLDKDRINAIVLLSDGQDTDQKDPKLAKAAFDQLLGEINADRVESSVRVFTIPYTAGEHKEVLRQIAEVSKAATYDASDPRAIDDVFVSVFRNF
jgi:Ca-activated chloride channel family protein